MTLSIIIVNYNGEKYLSNCLESIELCCEGISYEVIIVDNASNDNSINVIKSMNNDKILLIENDKNIGFAKGNNLGVQNSKGRYILLLNNDTVLLNNLKSALDIFKQEKVGIVSIKMLGKDMEYRYSVGNFPTPLRLLKLSRLYKTTNEFKKGLFDKKLYKVDWVEGSFILTTKNIWVSTKGLDENYFMYVEDVDYCKKVSSKNYHIMYCPKLEYVHFGGYGSSREIQLKKGFKLYINEHMTEPTKILSKICLEFNFLVKRLKNIT